VGNKYYQERTAVSKRGKAIKKKRPDKVSKEKGKNEKK